MTVKGDKEVLRKLRELTEDYPDALGAALYQEALELHRDSVNRTPVDTGRLRQSAYAAPPSPNTSFDDMVAEVGYGTNYAIWVHERTELNHRVGEAKFLQNALDAKSKGYVKRVAGRVMSNVKRRLGIGGVSASAPTRPNDPGSER